MSVPICHHLKEDGVYCGSPALKDRDYCYFHLNLRGRRLKSARARRRGDNPPLNLPFPEDMHAVQLSLAEILWALAEHRIDHKTAGLILYTLQQASTNLNQTPRWQGERKAVESGRPLRALSDPNFEQRFDLPANTDLNADPEAAPSEDVGLPIRPSIGGVGVSSLQRQTQGAPPLSPAVGDRVGIMAPSPVEQPECEPIPEDELADLKMTRAEQIGFFNYCMSCDNIKNEQRLRLIWLSAKRAGMLDRTDEDRQNSTTFEAMFSEPAQSGDREAA